MTSPRRRAAVVLAVLIPLVVFPPALAAFLFRHRPWTPQRYPEVPTRGLTLRYEGITGYALDDGKTTILLDPVTTRPEIWKILLGPLSTDPALSASVFPRADYILIDHAHHDHVLDAPDIAKRTGATIVGSKSTANFARARGVPESKIIEVVGGEDLTLGTFRVRIVRSRHVELLGALGIRGFMEGVIPPDAARLWFFQHRQDAALAFHIKSRNQGSLWFHPTSTFKPGEFVGLDADALVVGVNGEGLTLDKLQAMAAEAPSVRLVLPTHYDNLFQPYKRGLALMPFLDLGAVRRYAAKAFPKARWVALDYGDAIGLP